MTKVISLISGKGGAGKTTAAIMIAGEYEVNGNRTLILDTDPRQNLMEWWDSSKTKNNLPEKMEVIAAIRSSDIKEKIEANRNNYDVIIVDTPGVDSQVRDTVLRESDIVVTPVQSNKDELKAAGEAASWIADLSEEIGRNIPQLILKTRITVPCRSSEAYRMIRPFVERLQEAEYNVSLIDEEMFERNCYKDIRSGYGTLQMMDMTETIKKARIEVKQIVSKIDSQF